MFEFNKNLIFKKFFLDNTYNFLISIFSISLIVWVIQAVNYLDFVTEDGHGLLVYLKYMLFSIPKIVSRLMPILFFITFFYTINKFEDDNELKIFWLNGVNVKKFTLNILSYSSIIMLIHILLSVYLVPLSQNKARTFIQKSNIDFFPSLINEKKFIDTVEDLTIYIDEKVGYNTYKNIYLKDSKDTTKVRIIFAKVGNLQTKEKKTNLVLYDGKIININNNKINNFNFETTIFDLSNYITKSTIDFKIQEKSTSSIVSCFINFHLLKKNEFYDVNNCTKDNYSMIQEELSKRFIKPLYYFSIAICVCFLLVFSKEKSNFKIYRFNVFFFGFLILVISEMSISLSGMSFVSLISTMLLPLMILLTSLIILNQKFLKY